MPQRSRNNSKMINPHAKKDQIKSVNILSRIQLSLTPLQDYTMKKIHRTAGKKKAVSKDFACIPIGVVSRPHGICTKHSLKTHYNSKKQQNLPFAKNGIMEATFEKKKKKKHNPSDSFFIL